MMERQEGSALPPFFASIDEGTHFPELLITVFQQDLWTQFLQLAQMPFHHFLESLSHGWGISMPSSQRLLYHLVNHP